MRSVLFPAESALLQKELQKLKKQGIKVNLNRLGEAILGEQEALKRIQDSLTDIENPLVDAISIKISSIYRHINLLAWDDTLAHLKERYRRILRHSMRFQKTVFLDMEEYKDLELTYTLFREVWNFPCSIPTSAILSSLATLHSVIFKPAYEAVLTGWHLCQALWKAGVSKRQLQFITCLDEPVGSYLINDPRVDKVILTGSTATARHFLKMRPTLKLFGETGGKNSIIVTSLSDRDLAVKDIVQSAFGYAGQKCSACSLLILEKEVYVDETFKKQLLDAASSLLVGSSFNPATQVTPLISQASPHLYRALTMLEEGEEWLLKPLQDKNNSQAWSPGIKYGVKPNSFTHTTEFFGPILAVMCAKDLPEAVELANGTSYGLTAGLHSLNTEEQRYWLSSIKAGNCYINRPITGAIVGRQPFGGCKASSFGIGMKVGGPNYLLQLVDYTEVSQDDSYSKWWDEYFSKQHILQTHLGQDNILYFEARSPLYFLLQEHDSIEDRERVRKAASIAGCTLIECKDIAELITFIQKESAAHVLALSAPDDQTLQAISSHILSLDIHKPNCFGRIELLHVVREISVSKDYHRYGNLLGRVK